MSEENRDLGRRFIAALNKGELPDDMFTDDMTVWTTSSGEGPGSNYQNAVNLLQTLFPDGLHYTIDAITAEENRVVLEVRSKGTLINGEVFANTYVFILRINDGRIAHVAEHVNPVINNEVLMPLFTRAMAEKR